MDKIEKFLLKLTRKERGVLSGILSDIRVLRLEHYDMKPLKGQKKLFRIRKGKIRIIFAKGRETGILVNIGYRKDVYN